MRDKTSCSVILKPQTLHWIITTHYQPCNMNSKIKPDTTRSQTNIPEQCRDPITSSISCQAARLPWGQAAHTLGCSTLTQHLLLTQSHADVTGLLPLSAPMFTFIKTSKQSIAQHLQLCDIPPCNVSCDCKMLLSWKWTKAEPWADSECPLLLLLKTAPRLTGALINQKANSSFIFCEPTSHCK